MAICTQNCRSTSRRCEGAPGERIASRPVKCFIYPAVRPINTAWLNVLRRPAESALRSAFRVGNQIAIEHTVVQGLLQRVDYEIRPHRRVRARADDATREHVDHERDVYKAAPRRDVREVRDPQLIGTLGVKLPLHRILRELRRGVGDRLAMTLPAHDAAQAIGGHESGDGAARNRPSITQQLPPHFTHAVHAAIPLPHALDLLAQQVVALRTRRTSRRIHRAGGLRLVARRCDPPVSG